MDRSFNVIMGTGVAGPVAARPFDLGRSDVDKALEVDVYALNTGCIVFAGSLSTTDCQNILGATTNLSTNVGEIVAVCASGGMVKSRVDETVRSLTVYLLANAPAQQAGVTLRVRNCHS